MAKWRIAELGDPRLPPEFWEKVRLDRFGCWIFGDPGEDDYGSFRGKGAHVVSRSTLVGPVPDGYYVDHMCLVKRCVNPEHLEPVPPGVNTRRGHRVTAARKHRARMGARRAFERPEANTIRSVLAVLETEVSLADLVSVVRTARVVSVRHAVCWHLRNKGLSFPTIGAAVNRDHSTAQYAVRRFQARVDRGAQPELEWSLLLRPPDPSG